MKKFFVLLLTLALAVSLCACDSANYSKAMAAFEQGDYTAAREIFVELGDYEDSAEMVKSCDYEMACELMEVGDYGPARAIFEALGDYKSSVQMAEECLTGEIDALLQGEWEGRSLYGLNLSYEFNAGRFNACLTITGESGSLENEGVYRIDVNAQEIYVTYDYTVDLNSGEKVPNTKEQKLFTFTYDGTTLVLTESEGEVATKK